MHARSGTATPGVGRADLVTGSDSPVSVDSSTSRACASITRQSAGTRAPASSSSTSPTTTSSAGTSTTAPSMRTRTSGALTASRSCSARSVCTRCAAPTSALTPTTPSTRPASVAEPTAADSAAPMPSNGVSGLASSSTVARSQPTRLGPRAGRRLRQAQGPQVVGQPGRVAAHGAQRRRRVELVPPLDGGGARHGGRDQPEPGGGTRWRSRPGRWR
ncbi:MAG: hypothetical protein R2699_10500 [Acidimicrobiales bacterium]